MTYILSRTTRLFLGTLVLGTSVHAGIPGFELPPACPPNASCVPVNPPAVPPTPPSSCGPGNGGPTCGGDGPASNDSSPGPNIGAGNPINLITGNKYQREVDMAPLPGILGLEIVRHYNSSFSRPNHSNNLVGRGWKLSYETELYVTGNSFQVIQADGTRLIFHRDPNNPGVCAIANPADGRLNEVPTRRGKEYIWRWTNGRELTFDTKGKLVQILAPGRQFVTLQYDSRGLLRTVTDPQGRSLRLHYLKKEDNSRRFRGVQAIDSPVGRFAYSYGSPMPKGATGDSAMLLANLTKVSMPAGARSYHYEDARFPTLLTGISELTGGGAAPTRWQRIATYGYDANGKGNLSVRGLPASLALTASGTVAQPAALVTGTGRDQVTLDHSRAGETIVTNSHGQKTLFRHAVTAAGYRLLEVRGANCTGCGETNVRYNYDQAGRLTGTTNLDADGRPVASSETVLDSLGRALRVTRTIYRNGKRASSHWQRRFEYVGSSTQPSLIGRPSVIPGKEHVTLMRYGETGAAAGLPVEVTERGFAPSPDGNGFVTIARTMSYRYDQYGQQTLADGPLPNAAQNAGPANSDITNTDYDPKTKLPVRTTLPGNIVTEVLERDAALRPTVVRTSDGALVRTTTTRYNWRGQPEEIRIVRGADDTTLTQVTGYRFDLSGRLTAMVQPDASTVTKKELAAPDRAADGADQVEAIPAALQTTAVETDESSRPVVWTDPQGRAALRAVWGPIGTAAESMIQAFVANQAEAIRLVDDFGRVTAIRNPGQGWQIAIYDAAGRITEMRDPRGAVQKASWDSAGRVLALQRFLPGATKPEQTLAYRYRGIHVTEQRIDDANGNRVTSLAYDGRGLMTGRTLTIEPAGKLALVMPTAITMTHRWRHDAQGRVIAQVYTDHQGKQLELKQQLDKKGLPVSITTIGVLPAILGGGNTVVESIQWQRQFATGIVHGDGSVDRFEPTPSTVPQASPLRRVAAVRGGVAGVALPGSPGEDVDTAGLPARINTTQGLQRLTWNAAGQLSQSTRSTGSSSYVYDAQGQRVVKLVADGDGKTSASISFYVENRLIVETDAQGAMRYAYAYLGWRPLAQFDLRAISLWQRIRSWLFGASARALHTDRVGRVLTMSDYGKTIWQERQVTSGVMKVSMQTGTKQHQPLRYVGQYHDDDSALVYHGARYFDPSSGRFVSPDPAGIDDALSNVAAPLLLDLYAYAGGQPDDYFDPDGAARIRYFAITTGASGQKLGTKQGFTKARWAFIVDNVAAGIGITPLGQTRNSYAMNRKALLVDIGGNFNAATPAQTWNGAGQENAFLNHYGSSLISLNEFTVEMNDDDAAKLIASYIAADRTRLFGSVCPARNLLLPAIRFAPGEADINVTRQVEPAVHGMAGNQANVQRILNCRAPSTVPVTYADDTERRRIVKYEAAAELQESPAPSAINRDCSTNNGCRSATDITLNDRSYYASYGRTQFVSETFLSHLSNLIPELNADQVALLRLNTAVRLPNGTTGTMAQMVALGKDRARAAANAFRIFRNLFGRAGMTTIQATSAWNSLTAAARSNFTRNTGFGLTEFIDMLAFVPSGRARTESEAQNAFGSEAARRILDGSGTTAFGDWLMWLYQSQDPYNFVSKSFLKKNLETIMDAPAISARFVNNETPGTEAYRTRQHVIEDELARRTAIIHNAGSGGTSVNINVPQYVQSYVNEFIGTGGRGDWRSLRCSDELGDTKGLQTQTLNLR